MFLKFLLFMRLSRHFADSICSILSSKNTCFRRRSDSHWTICLRNFFYAIKFTGFSTPFLSLLSHYPVRWFSMWYETYHSVVLWQKISPLLTPFINNAVDLSVNFILLLFCSFVAHLYNLYRIGFIVCFISLDLQFYQQLHTLLLFLVMQGKSLP